MATEPRSIDDAEAQKKGVWTAHSEMPSGELRFRLRNADGTSYIRTESTNSSGWQQSHFHERVLETYIVQKGQVGFVELVDKQLKIQVLRANDLLTTKTLVPHNVFLFPDTVIHTVKHGDEGSKEDRIPYPDLDLKTHHLSGAELISRAEPRR